MLWPEVGLGSPVRFKLANVVCPDMEQVIEKLIDSLEVTGRVVYLSDSGEKKDEFATSLIQCDVSAFGWASWLR